MFECIIPRGGESKKRGEVGSRMEGKTGPCSDAKWVGGSGQALLEKRKQKNAGKNKGEAKRKPSKTTLHLWTRRGSKQVGSRESVA